MPGTTAITALERAIAFAVAQHAGQTDKAGRPYILHSLRIMLAMDSDEERIAAVLHDTLEDCDGIGPEDLAALDLPPASLEAIGLLTHAPDEPYEAYVARLGRNPIARKVKLADLADNLDPGRLTEITARDMARMNKYLRARALLRHCAPADPP